MREKGIDKYANAIVSNVYKIHKQQESRFRVPKKARALTFYVKKVRETVCVGL